MDFIKDAFKNVRVEEPLECIELLKKIILKLYEKTKEIQKHNNSDKIIEDYEKMLQKSELKIRDLIRVHFPFEYLVIFLERTNLSTWT